MKQKIKKHEDEKVTFSNVKVRKLLLSLKQFFCFNLLNNQEDKRTDKIWSFENLLSRENKKNVMVVK